MNKIKVPKNPRILVTRTDRMGDVVLTTPVFRAIKARFPESYLVALVQPQNRDIVSNNPFIDEVLVYDKRGRQKQWWQSLFFARMLKQYAFDIVIHLHATTRVHAMSWGAKIPIRIGYDRKCGNLLTHRISDEKRQGQRHEAAYNFDVLACIDVPEPMDMQPELFVTHDDEAHLDQVLASHAIHLEKNPVIAINPGASCPSKVWPAERFARLADKLIERCDVQIIIIGDQATRDIAHNIRRYMRYSYTDLVGALTLKDLACLFKRISCVISNDTGPVHIASAVDVPVISLFGRSDPGLSPERWKPLGEKSFYIHKPHPCGVCRAHNCEHGFECLNNIHVADVVQLMAQYPAIFPWFKT